MSSGTPAYMGGAVSAYLAEDAARLAVGLVHQAEDGEVPAVELTHERLQVWEAHVLQSHGGFILLRSGVKVRRSEGGMENGARCRSMSAARTAGTSFHFVNTKITVKM